MVEKVNFSVIRSDDIAQMYCIFDISVLQF